MNGLRADGAALVRGLLEGLPGRPRGTIGICPPATLLAPLGEMLRGTGVLLGGQDCAPEQKGAFTGDIAAPMLADLGCRLVIVGHSERRHGQGEPDALIRAKAEAALATGLTPIVCIGETEAEKDAGRTQRVLDRQLEGSIPPGRSAAELIVAYEPVWAIGTGRSASAAEITAAHDHIRARLEGPVRDGAEVRVLYGGSVKPDNAREILALGGVDGVLVGGASLDAASFLAIYEAGSAAKATGNA
jgi:triosephosphate isomerase (TIM)